MHREGLVGICRFAGHLGVDTDDLTSAKKKSPQLIKAISGFRRHCQGGKAQSEQFFEDFHFPGIGVDVTFVGDQHGG